MKHISDVTWKYVAPLGHQQGEGAAVQQQSGPQGEAHRLENSTAAQRRGSQRKSDFTPLGSELLLSRPAVRYFFLESIPQFFSEKVERPLSNNYTISSDVSRS